MSNDGREADRDSLIALEALLRIRSESGSEPTEERSSTSPPSDQEQVGAVGVTPILTSSAPIPTTLGPQVSSSPYLNHAPFYPQAPTFLHLEPAALSAQKHQPAPAIPVSPALHATHPLPKLKHAAVQDKEKESKRSIRKDEVEAALRSKPQRGRKRDNLSALERLELTRTRNREHAKSTRIRKKARYQELLDSEEKYIKMQKLEEFVTRRQECVMRFLSLWETMLKPRNDRETSIQGPGPTGLNNKVVSFQEGQSKCEFGDSQLLPLGDVVEEPSMFRFELLGHSRLLESSEQKKTGVEALHVFNFELCAIVQERMQEGHNWSLLIKPPDSSAVSVNRINDVGYCDIQVELQGLRQSFVLVRAILKCCFAPSSEKLESVQWCTLHENFEFSLDDGGSEEGSDSSSSSESLGCQTSYPSVVSLDHSAFENCGEKTAGESGMNF